MAAEQQPTATGVVDLLAIVQASAVQGAIWSHAGGVLCKIQSGENTWGASSTSLLD